MEIKKIYRKMKRWRIPQVIAAWQRFRTLKLNRNITINMLFYGTSNQKHDWQLVVIYEGKRIKVQL